MSGRIGDLSDQQSQALKSFRSFVSQGPLLPVTQTTDVDLLRFLRARSFNVVAAFKQWKECQLWREEFGVEDITKGPYPLADELKSTLALAYCGEDLDHRPLYLERSGAVDPLIVAALNPDEVVRRHIYHQEKQVQRVEEHARRFDTPGLDNWCEIHDMRGLSLQHRQVLGIFTRLARIDSDFYPERAGRIFFINVPAVFPALWKICRRALDARTREKFVVLSASRTKELLDYFAPDQLPVEYGGTAEGVFPVMSTRRESRPLTGVKFTNVQILPRRRAMRSMKCSASDTVSWYCRVVAKDVKFCAYWSSSTDEVNIDSPVEVARWLEASSAISEAFVISASSDGYSDSFFCSEPGVLGLVWENDSIFQSRTISFQSMQEKSIHDDVGPASEPAADLESALAASTDTEGPSLSTLSLSAPTTIVLSRETDENTEDSELTNDASTPTPEHSSTHFMDGANGIVSSST